MMTQFYNHDSNTNIGKRHTSHDRETNCRRFIVVKNKRNYTQQSACHMSHCPLAFECHETFT